MDKPGNLRLDLYSYNRQDSRRDRNLGNRGNPSPAIWLGSIHDFEDYTGEATSVLLPSNEARLRDWTRVLQWHGYHFVDATEGKSDRVLNNKKHILLIVGGHLSSIGRHFARRLGRRAFFLESTDCIAAHLDQED